MSQIHYDDLGEGCLDDEIEGTHHSKDDELEFNNDQT